MEVSEDIINPTPPDRIIEYPVTGDEKGGRLFLYGNPNADKIVFLCGGFPDDHKTFMPMAARLATKEGGECFCGVACLVGYEMDKPLDSYKPEGYTIAEMTTSLRSGAKALRAASTNPKAKLSTIFHDWGSAIGGLYTNQALEENDALTSPEKIIYFDVAPISAHPSCPKIEPAKKSLKERVTEEAYRIVFAVAFMLQRFISHYLAAFVLIFSFAILGALGVVPSSPKDSAIMESRKTPLRRTIYMCYSYYYAFAEWYCSSDGRGIFEGFHLPSLNETSVLYLYGKDKKIQFHDENVVNFIAEQPNCEVIAVEDAEHWLYLQQQDICFDAVQKFIYDGS